MHRPHKLTATGPASWPLVLMMALLLGAGGLAAGSAWAGPLQVSDSWARATPPGARTAAVYITVTGGEASDRLLGGTTAYAREVQVHTHIHADGMMRMEQIPALDIPAGGTVSLRPGGDHIMLIGLQQALVAGATMDLILTFEQAGDVALSVPVRDAR